MASGQAAETLSILNLAGAGNHLVSSPSLYGGTNNLFHYTLPKLGVEVSFVDDPDDLDQWQSAIRDNTKCFFGESIGNPGTTFFDFEGVSKIAHDPGIPVTIDNTVPSPYLCNPLQHGADIVVHSATKVLGGHGTSIGGNIVDGGQVDFGASGRFPGFTARPQLPRPCVLGRPRPRLVHPQGQGAVAARHGAGHGTAQRVPLPAASRDTGPAHGTPRG